MNFSEITGSLLAIVFLSLVTLAFFRLSPKLAPKVGLIAFGYLAVRASQQYSVNYIFVLGCFLLTVGSAYMACRGLSREKRGCRFCRIWSA